MELVLFIRGRESSFPRYTAALRRCGCTPRFSLRPEDAAGCAGLLLPGGGDVDPHRYGQVPAGSAPPDPLRDDAELGLARRFLAEKLPVLGICRGLQVLNVALGGSLIQDLPGHAQLNGADRVHPVRAEPGSLMDRLYGPRFLVNSAHHQAADALGNGLRATLRAEDGIVEALEHESLPVLGVQWHPERMPAEAGTDGLPVFETLRSLCAESGRVLTQDSAG